MDELLNTDKTLSRNALQELQQHILQNQSYLSSNFEKILDLIIKSEDDFISQQLSVILSNFGKKNKEFALNKIEKIFETFNKLADKPMNESNLWETCITILFQIIQTDLQSNSELFVKSLPTLFNLVNKGENIKYIVSAPITTFAMQNPQLLKDHVPEIFKAMRGGFTSISSSLTNLYKFDPETFENNLDFLFEMFQKDTTWQSMALNLISNITKNKPYLITEDQVKIILSGINNPAQASLVVMVLEPIAGLNPQFMFSSIDQIHQATLYNDYLLFQVPNILGLLGRASQEVRKKIIPMLDSYLNSPTDTVVSQVIGEFRNIAEIDKEIVSPYIDKIRNFEESNQEYVRDQAKMFIDFIEGKDLRSISNKIDEQNELIKTAATSTEDLMKYIDDNIHMLKDFIADISKKLPTPRRFSTEGRIRKVLILEFVCDDSSDRCIFPDNRPFTTESKSWSKWLKIAFSGIKIGRSLIMPAALGDAGNAVKQAYQAYKSADDAEFLQYISEPFLTSIEQDTLIMQLREAKFFDVFFYSAQTAGWFCTMCNLG